MTLRFIHELSSGDLTTNLVCSTLRQPSIAELTMVLPVFALFRAEVHVIDEAKKAELAKLVSDNVTATTPGERLDHKLAELTLTPAASERRCRGSSRG